MNVQDLGQAAGARLKFFLARQIGRGKTKSTVVSTQQAAVLATLAMMKHYAGEMMSGVEIRRLFGWPGSGGSLTNVITTLKNKSLVEEDDVYHRITSGGAQALAQFADEVLGTPEPVEAELRRNKKYQDAVGIAETLIDADLSQKFKAALKHPAESALRKTGGQLSYSWPDVLGGAKTVGDSIFKDFRPNAPLALLTFPGPGLTFAGLVLATLPPEDAIRVPVYTCIFVDENAPEPDGFHPVLTEPEDAETTFKVLVPAALTDGDPDHQRKIVAIDDTIISGVTMRALRKYFRGRGYADRVPFACCVCYEARTVRGEVPPEAVGMVSPVLKFHLPWGDGFSLESLKTRGAGRPHPPARPEI